jgi:hypothetical protein
MLQAAWEERLQDQWQSQISNGAGAKSMHNDEASFPPINVTTNYPMEIARRDQAAAQGRQELAPPLDKTVT